MLSYFGPGQEAIPIVVIRDRIPDQGYYERWPYSVPLDPDRSYLKNDDKIDASCSLLCQKTDNASHRI